MNNNELPRIEKSKYWQIIDEVIPKPLPDQDPPKLSINSSFSDLYIDLALPLCKVNPGQDQPNEAKAAFGSVVEYIEAKLRNNDYEISYQNNTKIEDYIAGENQLADMILKRKPISKVDIAESLLQSMQTYSQTAYENLPNYEKWEPLINEQIEFYKNGIQVIDESKD